MEDKPYKDRSQSPSRGQVQAASTKEFKLMTIESQYFQLYKDLLRDCSDAMFRSPEEQAQDYREEESNILKSILATQRNAWIVGASIGVASFVSLRVLPRYMLWRIGGNAKVQAYQEKLKQQAKNQSLGMLQGLVGSMLEGSFSLWVGYRGYCMTLEQHTIYDVLADIPLCAGRSTVSDVLCNNWIAVTEQQIPPTFWANLDTKGDMDESWRAIRRFSDNCVKRRAYEHVVRIDRGMTDEQPVVLPGRVPEDISISEANVTRLSKKEATQLTTDRA